MKIKEWLEKEQHLPNFMRDFHDQKDLFKAIHEVMKQPTEAPEGCNWVQAHMYTIDSFLSFMAQCGYTLQKSRKKLEFADVQQIVNQRREIRRKIFFDALKNHMKKENINERN